MVDVCTLPLDGPASAFSVVPVIVRIAGNFSISHSLPDELVLNQSPPASVFATQAPEGAAPAVAADAKIGLRSPRCLPCGRLVGARKTPRRVRCVCRTRSSCPLRAARRDSASNLTSRLWRPSAKLPPQAAEIFSPGVLGSFILLSFLSPMCGRRLCRAVFWCRFYACS